MYVEQPPSKGGKRKCKVPTDYEWLSEEEVEDEEEEEDEYEDDAESVESSYSQETYNAKVNSSGEIVRIKARHFTDKEKLKLVFLVAKNADAIECKKCDSMSLRNKALTWQKITREFNKTEKTNWDVRQLKKLWENTKARARKAIESGMQKSGNSLGNSEAQAIKVLDSLSSSTSGFNLSSITDTSSQQENGQYEENVDSSFINFLKDEIISTKGK